MSLADIRSRFGLKSDGEVLRVAVEVLSFVPSDCNLDIVNKEERKVMRLDLQQIIKESRFLDDEDN